MEAKLQRPRPKHLNLLKIKQPLPAIVSILHRISGVLLFFPGIPLFLYSLQLALGSEASYQMLMSCFDQPVSKIILILSAWFLLHHFCAGIRYLALDLHYGVGLAQTRASSKIVLISGIILTAIVGFAIW